MKVKETELEGVVIIEPKVYEDERGYFFESFSEKWFRENAADTRFVQDNESLSRKGVIRGLHYQLPPHAQAKLVSVAEGAVLDVAVDIRRGSPAFGKYVAVELNDRNRLRLFIPRGFAHGFVALSERVKLQYKCDNYYAPQSERTLRFDDPQIGIAWGVEKSREILSEKDLKSPLLVEAEVFDYNG